MLAILHTIETWPHTTLVLGLLSAGVWCAMMGGFLALHISEQGGRQ